MRSVSELELSTQTERRAPTRSDDGSDLWTRYTALYVAIPTKSRHRRKEKGKGDRDSGTKKEQGKSSIVSPYPFFTFHRKLPRYFFEPGNHDRKGV